MCTVFFLGYGCLQIRKIGTEYKKAQIVDTRNETKISVNKSTPQKKKNQNYINKINKIIQQFCVPCQFCE